MSFIPSPKILVGVLLSATLVQSRNHMGYWLALPRWYYKKILALWHFPCKVWETEIEGTFQSLPNLIEDSVPGFLTLLLFCNIVFLQIYVYIHIIFSVLYLCMCMYGLALAFFPVCGSNSDFTLNTFFLSLNCFGFLFYFILVYFSFWKKTSWKL